MITVEPNYKSLNSFPNKSDNYKTTHSLKSDTVIIEFTGVGGSGKSYISKALTSVLGSSCVHSSEIRLTSSDVFIYVITRPRRLISIIEFIRFLSPINLSACWMIFRKILVHQMRIEKVLGMKRYVVVDEGFLHALRLFRKVSRRKVFYEDIPSRIQANMLLRYNFIIHLAVSFEVVHKRRLKRSREDPSRPMGSSQKNDYSIAECEIERDVISYCQKTGACQIRIDNNQARGAEEIAEDIAREIELQLSDGKVLSQHRE